jgi:hypothetical protein
MIEEIKPCLLNSDQKGEPNEKPKAEKIKNKNWLSLYYLKQNKLMKHFTSFTPAIIVEWWVF